MTQSKGLHHLHVRKRIYEKHEKYPHPNKFKRRYDNFMYAIAIIAPLTVLPQLLKIWINKDAAGVSFFSWMSFAVMACFWLIYGIIHKERRLIIMYAAFAIIQIVVAIGAIIY